MQDYSANNKRIAKNSIYMSIRMLIVLLISLYITRLVLATLGIVDYGIYNVVYGFVSMFTFVSTSLSNGIQRFVNFEYGKNGIEGAANVFRVALLIQTVGAIILVLLIESFGGWYILNKMVIPVNRIQTALLIFHCSTFSFMLSMLQVPFMAVIVAFERMDYYALVSVIDILAKLGIVILLPTLNGDRLVIYGFCYSLVSILDFILYVIYVNRKLNHFHINWNVDTGICKSMLGFSLWNFWGSFSGMMKEQGINLILNLFFGPVVNAARGIAVQINSGLQSFVSNITVPVRPQVIQSYAEGDIGRTMKLTFSVSKLSSFFLYMIALPLIYEMDFVLRLWLGDTIPAHTKSFAIIIILISFLNNLNSAISGVVHATGKMKLYQIATSLTALLALPLSYYFLHNGHSPEMAFVMVLVCMVLAQAVAVIVLRRLVDFAIMDYLTKVIMPLLLVFLSTGWIPHLLVNHIDEGWMRLVVTSFVSEISTIIAIYMFGLQQTERQIIINLLKQHAK